MFQTDLFARTTSCIETALKINKNLGSRLPPEGSNPGGALGICLEHTSCVLSRLSPPQCPVHRSHTNTHIQPKRLCILATQDAHSGARTAMGTAPQPWVPAKTPGAAGLAPHTSLNPHNHPARQAFLLGTRRSSLEQWQSQDLQ